MRLETPLDDVFRSGSAVRILRAVAALPEGFAVSAREISRRAGVSHPTASATLAGFVDQGLVLVGRTPWRDGYELNRENILAGPLMELFHLERSVLEELLSFLGKAISRDAGGVKAAYLFGSAVWGEMMPSSDLDIAVLSSPTARADVEAGMERVAASLKARFGNRLNVLVRTFSEGTLESLLRGERHPGSRLWQRILKEGVPIPLNSAPAGSRIA